MMRMLRDWGIALGLAAAIFVVLSWLQPTPDLPAEAPLFVVQTIDGDRIDLAELRGRTVVLNFWASWCAPCKAEAPAFTRFAESRPDIAVIGLAIDSGGPAEVRRAARAFGIAYPVAIADSKIQVSYDISTLPTTIVMDTDGSVKGVHVGQMSFRQLSQAVR